MSEQLLSLWRGPMLRTPADDTTAIIVEVAVRRGLTLALLIGRRQDQAVSRPRQEAMWELRQRTTLSLPQIGRKFGRDHTTVIHGLRAHERRMAEA